MKLNHAFMSALSIGLLLGCSEGGTLADTRAEMVLDPVAGSTIEFDEVVLGAATGEPRVIRIENRGDFALQFTSIQTSDPQFRVSSAPESVAPGARSELFLRFEPAAPGTVSGMLELSSNDRELPTASFTLSGTARERCQLELSPQRQTFALDEAHEIVVSAGGTQPCEIVRVDLDRELFAIEPEPTTPFVVNPQEPLALQVRHVAVPLQPGIPLRELRVKEAEGTEVAVTLEGQRPIENCLRVSPEFRMLFPQTAIGQVARMSAVVSNDCTVEAQVTSAVIGTGYSYEVSTSGFPLAVPPLGSLPVEVTYSPLDEAGDSGLVNINTNDAANPRFSLELFGEAAKPRVQVFPELVDFGDVIARNIQGDPARSECGSQIGFVQLYSVGDAEVVINGLEFESPGDELFQVQSVLVDGEPVIDPQQPITVPPNKEGRINLRFYPSRLNVAEHESVLLVHHNAEGSPSRIVVRGRATDDVVQAESFTQLDGPRIDVLFVVQNTFLTEDEHSKLRAEVESFVQLAESANADYQMAVVVTDARSANAGLFERCNPHPAIITSSYADQATRIAALDCTLNVGVSGSFLFVSGLGAALRGIERAQDIADQDPISNPNAGFIRPDARLMIVVLSPRDDDSVESNALLRDYFLSVKGAHRPDRVAVHAIAGPVLTSCPAQHQFLVQPGYRYFWMTEQLGGVFFDVCEDEWSPFFADIGLDAFSPIDEWDLSGIVDPATISVLVDGTAIPLDAMNGYFFDVQTNSIRFGPSAIPPAGANVDISYRGLCR